MTSKLDKLKNLRSIENKENNTVDSKPIKNSDPIDSAEKTKNAVKSRKKQSKSTLSISINEENAKLIKIHATVEEINISDIYEELSEKYIKSKNLKEKYKQFL